MYCAHVPIMLDRQKASFPVHVHVHKSLSLAVILGLLIFEPLLSLELYVCIYILHLFMYIKFYIASLARWRWLIKCPLFVKHKDCKENRELLVIQFSYTQKYVIWYWVRVRWSIIWFWIFWKKKHCCEVSHHLHFLSSY